MIYDLIIIGSGPAGMTAGIYAARRAMKTLIIGKELGGQLVWANEIENYPGFELIKAYELINKIKNQTVKTGVEFENLEVSKIELLPSGNFLLAAGGKQYQARTVINSMGLSPKRLDVPGEVLLNGKGVSYCANCDGPFYKDKVVAIVGGGNSALDAAEFMSKIAKKVFLIHRRDEFKAFNVLVRQVNERSNVELLMNTKVKAIVGESKLESIKVISKRNQDLFEEDLVLDGIFIEVGRIASTDLVLDFVDIDNSGQILTDVSMATKTPGFFAAGDIVSSEYKQITIAMGQATVAALSAYQYLQMKEK